MGTVMLPEPVYEPQDQSPVLPPDGFVLDFSLQPSLNAAGGPSVALFASVRVPGKYADIYGGRLAGAIQIVAVASDRGAVYARNAEVGATAPLPLVMNYNPQPRPRGVAPVESAEAWFAVDLRAHLNLPPEAGNYTMFLWLDEMASQPRTQAIPGKTAGGNAGPAWPNVLTRDAGPPPAGSPPILMNLGDTVAGRASGTFSLLGLDFRSRSVKWLSAPGPQRFHFDPHALFSKPGWLDAPDPPRRAFLVLCCGGQLSSIVAVGA